jgi:hypothetical protein
MGFIQFFILLAFVLMYVGIVGALIVRFAARGGYFTRGEKRESELAVRS